VAKFMDNATQAWSVEAASQLRDRVLDLAHQRSRDLAHDLGA
jgi:tRNA(Met) C34 N-acetyltransferase TmcA